MLLDYLLTLRIDVQRKTAGQQRYPLLQHGDDAPGVSLVTMQLVWHKSSLTNTQKGHPLQDALLGLCPIGH